MSCGDDAAKPANDAAKPAKLAALSPPSASELHPVIAVDLDDVLSQTNSMIAKWHNEKYGTKMDLSTFYCAFCISKTLAKSARFESTGAIFRARPVPGAREGVQSLKDMGYNLVIVTARCPDAADSTWEWVEKYFPGVFAHIVFTGQFKDAHKLQYDKILTNVAKSQVCADLKAQVLIDDSAENAMKCSTASSPTRVLLFGDYEWNKRISGAGDGADEMCFDRRLAAAGGKEFWKDETLIVPDGVPLFRVKDWSETVRWIRTARMEGRIL
ncbi:hypothetical protein C8J57DRAFT_1292269 [Mycena rebaudengoi]|nr:hypothetical protein C8J57DRAFT_1292269 [Mycena rebaudengoi]